MLHSSVAVPKLRLLEAALVLKSRTPSTPLGSGAVKPVRAGSTHCLEAAPVMKSGCGGTEKPMRAGSPHCSTASAGCQRTPLGSSFHVENNLCVEKPVRACSSHRLEEALLLKIQCRNPYRLKAALVPKHCCGLSVSTAWKQGAEFDTNQKSRFG